MLKVCENRVLRRIFGSKREEVPGEYRKLYNEGLNHLYSSLNIIWAIKSRGMRWAAHVARMEERGDLHTWFWWGNLKDRDKLEDLGVDWRIRLKWVNKCGKGSCGLD
jgi:hypothetical protein